MIDKEDINDFEMLILLNTITPSKKTILKRLFIKYIDKKGAICMNCTPQIRNAFKRLKDFYLKNKNQS